MRKRPLRAGGCTAATAIRRACRPRALRVCGSTTARQARAAQSDAAASKSSRASSAAATDGDPLVRVPADAFVPSNRRAWRCAPAQPGQRRRPWTWSLFLLNTSRRTWRRKVVVSARPRERSSNLFPAPPANKAPVSTLRSLPRTRIYPIPHLQARPHARSNTKCLRRGSRTAMNCRAQHAHVVQHTHSTHTRAECARDEYTALRPSDPSARRPREALDNSLRGG